MTQQTTNKGLGSDSVAASKTRARQRRSDQVLTETDSATGASRMTTPLSKALIGAAALFLTSQPVHAQDGELWLRCQQTSNEGWDLGGNPRPRNWVSGYDYFRIISQNSITGYARSTSGEIDSMGDICAQSSSSCSIDDDRISVRYQRYHRERHDVLINRRTGELTVTALYARPGSSFDGARTALMRASCTRTTDPRPPAAF